MDSTVREDSKYLSYLLRHRPDEVKCEIDEHGWVDIRTLCRNSKFTLSYLELIVSEDTRYEFNQDMTKIRAFHGHSIGGIVPYTEIKPQGLIFHGTSVSNVAKIKSCGFIMKMSRNYVHSSYDETIAKAVGSRHGKPVILVIDAVKMYEDGFKFYESGDNIVLSDDIPIKYVIDFIEM